LRTIATVSPASSSEGVGVIDLGGAHPLVSDEIRKEPPWPPNR
jgi:hypothetical protein